VSFFVKDDVHGKSLSWGFKNMARFGPEWCSTVYASNSDVFKAQFLFHLKNARGQNLSSLTAMMK
jgi:hypothetical protein